MSGIIKVTSVIIGTIIGAGFISGQEIYSFFNKYGNYGQIGIFISMGLISIIIYKTLKIVYEKNILDYEELLNKTIIHQNKFIIYTIKNIINIFLIISYFIMCSAFSTYCTENYNIPKVLGGVIISIFSYLILRKDIKAIIKTNELLIPFIIVFIIIIGLITIKWKEINNYENNLSGSIIKGILYANYNCITLIPMLITLKNEISTKKQIKIIGIISFTLLYLLTEIIYLSQSKLDVYNVEMPMLEVSRRISIYYVRIYGIMTGIAIFTSAIASAYSLTNIIKTYKKTIIILLCVISIPISTISFSNLVNLAYPIFGLLGIMQIIFILKT